MAIIDSVKLPDNSTYEVADNHSGYAKKVAGATTDDLASLTATGDLADSGKKLSDLVLKTDVKDVLNSTSTTDPLSANQGRLVADNLAANENVYGAKNLFENVAISQTINGLVITKNADQSITCTSNNVALSNDVDILLGVITLPVGRYIVSNAHNSDAAIGGNNYFTYLTNVNGSASWVAVSTYDVANRILDITTETQIQFRLYGDRNEIFPATTFYPMLRDARILDPTFVPFAKTNRELTKLSSEQKYTNGSLSLYKKGNLVTLVTNGWVDVTSGNVYIPDGFRPYLYAFATVWGSNGLMLCQISDTGTIQLFETYPAVPTPIDDHFMGSMSWYTT